MVVVGLGRVWWDWTGEEAIWVESGSGWAKMESKFTFSGEKLGLWGSS